MVDEGRANPVEVPTPRYDFQRRQLPSFSPEDGRRTYNCRGSCRNGHSTAFVRAGVPEKCSLSLSLSLSLCLSLCLTLFQKESVSQPGRQSSQREFRLDPARARYAIARPFIIGNVIRADPERILAVLS